MNALVWLRRDLRVHDHPALCAALRRAELVVCAFVFDDRLLHGRHASGARTQFMLESLHDLDRSLRERGSRLVIRHGAPEHEVPRLAREVDARELHFTADVSPFARDRGRAVGQACVDSNIELHDHPGLTIADDAAAIRTQKGKPHGVFTPYYRAWLEDPRRPVEDAPSELPPLPDGLDPGEIPSLAELGLQQEVADPAPGGESAGRARMQAWLEDGVAAYGSGHDRMADEHGTSRLAAYLRFGCVSVRELEERLPQGRGAGSFRRQLCWRDFYQQVLRCHPDNAHHEYQQRYRDRIDWVQDDEAFEAWTSGQTGFPLVDAAMRQLRGEGYMHNRARLVVGSFLTKDLGIDWRRGERWFMRMLLDGDEANNNGNWQWIASVGTDPQPAFRRIYNPARQIERFDPKGVYVRRWVPELRDVPAEHLAEPWQMPGELQQQVGCVIGSDYPAPLVDHKQARMEALERYKL